MPPKLFSFTHFRKNASATPLVSHTFKTKDLKPFRFTHLQKNVGVPPVFHSTPALPPLLPLPPLPHLSPSPASNLQPQTDHPTRMVVPSERSESRESSFQPPLLGAKLSHQLQLR